jgi:hypothetical protein
VTGIPPCPRYCFPLRRGPPYLQRAGLKSGGNPFSLLFSRTPDPRPLLSLLVSKMEFKGSAVIVNKTSYRFGKPTGTPPSKTGTCLISGCAL